MTRKLMLVLGAALMMTLLPLATAHAQSYPPNGTVQPSNPTVIPGGTIAVTACCFQPGTTVTFTLGGTTGVLSAQDVGAAAVTATADENGVATAELSIPEGASGTLTIVASGTGTDGEPVEFTTTVEVAADGGSDDGDVAPLPRTGSDSSTPMIAIAIVLLCVGAAAVVTSRRRITAKGTAE